MTNLYIVTLTMMKMAQADYCMAMVGRTFTNTQYSNPWKAISNEKKPAFKTRNYNKHYKASM